MGKLVDPNLVNFKIEFAQYFELKLEEFLWKLVFDALEVFKVLWLLPWSLNFAMRLWPICIIEL